MRGQEAAPHTVEHLCQREGIDPLQLDALVTWARGRAKAIVDTLAPDADLRALLAASAERGLPGIIEDVEDVEDIEVIEVIEDVEVIEVIENIEDVEDAEQARGGPPPGTAHPGRRHPRYPLEHPVHVHYERWEEFIELYTRDISRGGMFVRTAKPPEMQARVTLRLSLPGRVRDLVIEGEVVHAVSESDSARMGLPAGFGVQFVGLTPERRQLLEQVVEHARAIEQGRVDEPSSLPEADEIAPSASASALRLSLRDDERQRLEALRAEIDQVRVGEDHCLLGVSRDAGASEIRAARNRWNRRWRREGEAPQTPPEIRALAGEALELCEKAAERLEQRLRGRARPAAAVLDVAGVPEPVIRELTPIHNLSTSDHDAARPPSNGATRRGLRQKLARMLGLKRVEGPSTMTRTAGPARSRSLDDAVEAINEKRYPAAITLLEGVLRHEPNHRRAQVMLHFARARELVALHKLPEAIEAYERVLELNPDHAPAKRDLAVLRCL